MVKHALASSAYNERRAQCETGVKHFAQSLPHVKALRDVTIENSNGLAGSAGRSLSPLPHVITENARVLSAAEALDQDDLYGFVI